MVEKETNLAVAADVATVEQMLTLADQVITVTLPFVLTHDVGILHVLACVTKHAFLASIQIRACQEVGWSGMTRGRRG